MIPEYLKFIDVHLSLKVIDFLLSKNPSDSEKKELLSLKANQLLQTKLFEEIQKFFEENPSLKNEEKLSKINNQKNSLKENENNLKDLIFGFTNMINNMKENPDFDFTTPINKKIVNFFF